MGQFKTIGDPTAAMIEEAGEIIQVLAKKIRFGGNWDDIPPGKTKSRWEQLRSEVDDFIHHWERLQEQKHGLNRLPDEDAFGGIVHYPPINV